jgi:hypothetical protein
VQIVLVILDSCWTPSIDIPQCLSIYIEVRGSDSQISATKAMSSSGPVGVSVAFMKQPAGLPRREPNIYIYICVYIYCLKKGDQNPQCNAGHRLSRIYFLREEFPQITGRIKSAGPRLWPEHAPQSLITPPGPPARGFARPSGEVRLGNR